MYHYCVNKSDYSNSITNLSNSILNHFGVEPFHNTIPEVDKVLEGKKKVIVFLFDALGKAILEKHLKEKSFFGSHIIHNMSSTTPPTTVASTTSFLSGKYPIENGWLGWCLYFSELDKCVNVFTNMDDLTGEPVSEHNVMREKCPYKDIAQLINEKNGKDIAQTIFGYPVDKQTKEVRKLNSFVKYAFDSLKEKDEGFTYAYWPSPDNLMHMYGTNSFRVHMNIKKIERTIKKYSKKNPDTAVLVIADHGMIDVIWENIAKHEDLTSLLVKPMTIEKRCANFYVQKGKESEFKEIFNKYYKDYYILLTKDEAIEQKIFGDAKPSKNTLNFMGDFIGLATSNLTLEWPKETKKKHVPFKGHHAGNSLDELEIAIIGLNLK